MLCFAADFSVRRYPLKIEVNFVRNQNQIAEKNCVDNPSNRKAPGNVKIFMDEEEENPRNGNGEFNGQEEPGVPLNEPGHDGVKFEPSALKQVEGEESIQTTKNDYRQDDEQVRGPEAVDIVVSGFLCAARLSAPATKSVTADGRRRVLPPILSLPPVGCLALFHAVFSSIPRAFYLVIVKRTRFC